MATANGLSRRRLLFACSIKADVEMVEESIPYVVEILELTQDRFRIRMRNAGEPAEMTLVPAG